MTFERWYCQKFVGNDINFSPRSQGMIIEHVGANLSVAMLLWIWGWLSLLGNVSVGVMTTGCQFQQQLTRMITNVYGDTLKLTCFLLKVGIRLWGVCLLLTPNFNRSFQKIHKHSRSVHLAISRLIVNSLVIPRVSHSTYENIHYYVILHHLNLDLWCIHFWELEGEMDKVHLPLCIL